MAYSLRKVERRQQSRKRSAEKLRVLWLDADGRECVCVAELVDISANGLRIRVDIQMAPRTCVMVNDRKIGITGRGLVRYCRYAKGKYEVGLEFSSGIGWQAS